MTTTSRTAASGVIWSAVSQGIRLAAQVAGMVVLARLLPASDFGLVAMSSIVTGLATLFRDFGTAAAVIQRIEVSPDLLDSVFWFNIAVGSLLAVGIIGSAPLVARLFLEPRLVGLLVVSSIAFPLNSLGLVHQSLMERASNFRVVALIEGAGALSGLGAALFGAWSGMGAYSLILQSVTSALIGATLFWMASAWRPRSWGSRKEIRSIYRFSGNLVGFNFFNYFARNADNMLVGRFLGAADLGYYTMAYRLMLWPLQNISSVVTRALLPVFSRMQSDRERLSSAYVKATAAMTLVSAPIMLGLFFLREPFIRVVLGPEWHPVATLLLWMAPIGLLQSVGTTTGTLYISLGRTDVMLRWGIIASTAAVVSFGIGIQWGLMGLVISYAIVSCLLFIPSLLLPYRLIRLGLMKVFRALAPSLVSACLMGLAIFGLEKYLFIANPFLRLMLLIAAGCLVYIGLTLLSQRSFLFEILSVMRFRKDRS